MKILAKSLLVSIAWLVACPAGGKGDDAPAVADAEALDFERRMWLTQMLPPPSP